MAKKLKTVDDNGEPIEGGDEDEDEEVFEEEEGADGVENEDPTKSDPEAKASENGAVSAPKQETAAEAAPVKQEVKAEAPTTAAAAAAPAAKVKSRPVSPAAAKDPAPSRRSSRAGKKAKVDYGALNAMGRKAVDYGAINGLDEEGATDDEDLLPAYDGLDVSGPTGTRRSSRARNTRKVVDYNQLMQGRRGSQDDDYGMRPARERDDWGRGKKDPGSMRNKYQSIFPDGYRSDCEEFDYDYTKRHRDSGYASDRDDWLRRKRGKYDVARALLGDSTDDDDDDEYY